MQIEIPVAGLTLIDNQTYNGQLPVWATRPLMVRVTPDFISGTEYPVYIQVSDGGAVKKTVTLPYQETVDLDLSFAAPLLTRADRNRSQGTPAFPQQIIEIWSSTDAKKITIPVFHCDETYWYTVGVDAALPQPPKPRIPGQTLDIYFPYSIHPTDAFSVEVEPVAGSPSTVIFPTKYVLGDTIDISYIKKLTIKNVWGTGLDQVINYEDRLMSDAIEDRCLQCALRARWNMRNGQWFWAAFKDFFWSNKFTAIRGRGGVTEQAEITVNLEYGREWYTVYQELLASSNIVFDLMIDGINQYQDKQFRAEVVGDTGARWSNSSKVYRQQVRFKTTELQDNYLFPLKPDQPPTPAIAFSARFNPMTISPSYSADRWNDIYSNAAWQVQSEPSWFTVISGTTLFKPEDFAQGGFGKYADLTPPESWIDNSPNYIRLKEPVKSLGEIYSLISASSGYQVQVYYLNSAGTGATKTLWMDAGVGRRNLEAYSGFLILLRFSTGGPITPSEVSKINMRYGKRYVQFPAGNSEYVVSMAQQNTGESRNGTLVLKSLAGPTTYNISITQQKASVSLSVSDLQVKNTSQEGYRITTVTANTSWDIIPDGIPSWLDINPVIGNAGTVDIFANIRANTGAQRVAYLTFRSRLNTSVTKILSVYQAGATGNISVDTPTIAAQYLNLPVVVNVTSFGDWSVQDISSWISLSGYEGPNGTTAVTLTMADNDQTNDPRTGTVKFQNVFTGEIATVTVTQAGAPYSIGLTPFRITGAAAGAGETKTVYCISNDAWELEFTTNFVSATPMSGPGPQTVSVIFNQRNTTGKPRSGYMYAVNKTSKEKAICIITQLG